VREVTRFHGFDGALPQRYASILAALSGTRYVQNPVPVTDDQNLFFTSAGPDGLSLSIAGHLADTASPGLPGGQYTGGLSDPNPQFARQFELLNGEAAARTMLSSHHDLLVLTITCRYYPASAGS
jgi:hypothetical protein